MTQSKRLMRLQVWRSNEIPTEPDEPTGAEEQQENAIEPRPTDMDLELAGEWYKQLIDRTQLRKLNLKTFSIRLQRN